MKTLLEIYEGKRNSSSNMIQKRNRQTTDQFHSVPSGLMFVVSRGVGHVPVPGVGTETECSP